MSKNKFGRKKFFKGLAASLVAAPFIIKGLSGKTTAQKIMADPISGAQEIHQWKMVTTWPPNFPVLGEVCNYFAEWVERMSGGRLQIKVYGGGELVPALEVFDAVKDGAAELGNGCSYYWAGKVPASQFFATIPFGMNAQQMNAWLINGGGQELWQEVYKDHNLIPFVLGNTGFQMGGWFNKEINSIADLKGLKMRMPGIGGKVLSKVGASPVLLPGSELYTGLERGIIDATEWIGPYHDYKMGFHQIAKYYYVNGWHEPGTAMELIINKEKYEALSPDLQEILETACMRANHWVLSEFEAKNSTYLQKLKSAGVQIRQYPDEVISVLKEKTKEVVNELIAADPQSKKVYESYNAFRLKINDWSEISEKQYFETVES